MSASECRVLIVDDNEDNRYTLTRRLRREGYTDVTAAADGREALARLAETDFDLVLLDIMMPEMDGYSVLENLRASGRLASLPVIVISAIDDFDSVVRCIELGAEDYLPKPFNATLLRARIAAVLEKKRLRDEVVRQLAIIREVFGKYVPASVAAQIVADQGQLKPTHATATILYSDIEAFTSIAETMPPEQVVQMLNEYFPAVIKPVEKHGGIVNQFQGDAMLITFNVPVADTEHADHAVRAALEMQQAVEGKRFAGVQLKTRIGIATGKVIAGNVGSGERINYTVHGDAVNLAARLEQLNKEHGTRILISAETVSLLHGDYRVEAMGAMKVRGKSAPVEIYAVHAECDT
jgi:class 3 adenylate cyclase